MNKESKYFLTPGRSPSLKSRTILDFFHGKQGEQAEGRALFFEANRGVLRPVGSDEMSHNTGAERELSDREFQQNDQNFKPTTTQD